MAARLAAARDQYQQCTGYLRKKISYNTAGIGTLSTVLVGVVPANAVIVRMTTVITEVFNAGTTNVLVVGYGASNNELVQAADVDETALGGTNTTRGIGLIPSATADTPIYVRYSQTGTAGTTGQAIVIVEFIPDRDN